LLLGKKKVLVISSEAYKYWKADKRRQGVAEYEMRFSFFCLLEEWADSELIKIILEKSTLEVES